MEQELPQTKCVIFLERITFLRVTRSWNSSADPGKYQPDSSFQELGIPMVVTNDVHYIREEDAVPHDLLLCIQTGKRFQTRTECAMKAGSII